jgi:hypothetical protein
MTGHNYARMLMPWRKADAQHALKNASTLANYDEVLDFLHRPGVLVVSDASRLLTKLADML